MRKIFVLFIVLLTVLSAFCGNNTPKTTDVSTTSLNLVMPDDTLSFGFSDSDTGTALSNVPVFYLWKYDVLTGVSTQSHATEGYSPYVLAKTEFYVWYDAFVGDEVSLVLNTPKTFEGNDKSSSIPVATNKTTGISSYITKIGDTETYTVGDDIILLEGGNEVVVANLDGNRIYKGREKYCVVLDISDAKNGVTYTGAVKLEVKAR